MKQMMMMPMESVCLYGVCTAMLLKSPPINKKNNWYLPAGRQTWFWVDWFESSICSKICHQLRSANENTLLLYKRSTQSNSFPSIGLPVSFSNTAIKSIAKMKTRFSSLSSSSLCGVHFSAVLFSIIITTSSMNVAVVDAFGFMKHWKSPLARFQRDKAAEIVEERFGDKST